MRRLLYCWICALTLISCSASDDGNTPSQASKPGGKVYRYAIEGTPLSLDPIKASTIYSNTLVVNLFDTLYSYRFLQRPYQLKPNLAKAMPTISEDGLTYTIELKTGVEFQDHPAFPGGQGREVSAQDFIYSIQRSFDPELAATGAWLWQGKIVGLDEWKQNGADYDVPVSGLKALDRYTIQIQLHRPYPQLIYSLAMGFAAITPREVVEALGNQFGSNPVGSGPFQLTHFDSQKAVLIPHEKFRKEPLDIYAEGYLEAAHEQYGLLDLHGRTAPFVDRLEIHFIEETSSRWQSFTKGNEVQYTTVPKDKQNQVLVSVDPLQLHPQITEKFHHSYGMEAGFVYHGFNMDDPNFGNTGDPAHDQNTQLLRCAIRKAHDWTQKNRAFYFGLGTVFPGVIPPSVPEYDPSISTASVTHDLAGARQMLQTYQQNMGALPAFEYHTNGSVLQLQFFEQMRGFLQQAGYPVEQITYHPYPSFGNFNRAIKNREAPFFFLGWTLDYPDAENTLQLFYGPNQTPGSNNFNYDNADFNRLYEMSSVMQPSAERTALYQQMNQMVIDDCVVISGLARNKIHLWHKNVITYPDRTIVGGYHLRYVDVK